MTDFRALCAELLSALENAIHVIYNEDRTKHISTAGPVIAKADAALAQPEVQGPTVMEIIALADEVEKEGLGQVDLVRRALARWSRPTTEPVPVAERLPGPEDCDAEGWCWWWHPDHKDEEFGDGWILLKSEWADGRHDADHSLIYTHWLPHHALPVPQQEAQP